jgi:monomeric isocitrate dehydrogenase
VQIEKMVQKREGVIQERDLGLMGRMVARFSDRIKEENRII